MRNIGLLFFLVACKSDPDRDGDGSLNDDDCGPDDATVRPGAVEGCDGIDHDCDGAVDPAGAISLGATPIATLDDALAAVAPGDTLRLCEGTWPSMAFTADITVEGTSAADVVIDAAGAETGVSMTGGALALRNLTITGATAAGVLAVDSASVTIADCVLTENSGPSGAAASLTEVGAVGITGSTISENEATGDGGAVFIRTDGDVDLTGTTFSRNTAGGKGGAVALVSLWDTTVLGGIFSANEATKDGGGLWVSPDDKSRSVAVLGATFEGNTSAASGGGLSVDDATGIALTGSTFTANQAVDRYGGGFGIASSADVDLAGVVVTGNAARIGGGGWIELGRSARIAGDAASRVEANEAFGGGGGLLLSGRSAVPTLSALQITKNKAPFGGGVQVESRGGVTFEDVTVAENVAATTGGGAYLFLNVDSTVTLTRTLFRANQATYSAGMYLDPKEDTVTLDVIGDGESTFQDNVASGHSGGAVLVSNHPSAVLPRPLSVSGLRFTGNRAEDAASFGGGLYIASTWDWTVSDCELDHNTANSGAGLYSYVRTATAALVRTHIHDNVASSGGGGVRVYTGAGGSLTLTSDADTLIENNSAFSGGGVQLSAEDSESQVTVSGLVLRGNHSDAGGGGLSASLAELLISDLTAEGNDAGVTSIQGSGGGVYVSGGARGATLRRATITNNSSLADSYGYGGGLYTSGNVTLDDVTVTGNTGSLGGGVASRYSGHSEWTGVSVTDNTAAAGGGVYLYFSDLTIVGATISGNTAENGAGVYVQDYPDAEVDSEIDASGATIADNTATNLSGGVTLDGGVAWTGGTISGNTAPDCGGMLVLIYDDSPAAVSPVSGVSITGNAATTEGGGLCVHQEATFSDMIIEGNSAAIGGGVSSGVGPVTFTGGSVKSNTASEAAGGFYLYSGVLTVDGTDLGSGASDNAPADVGFEDDTTTATFDDAASFRCDYDAKSCGAL